jgi:predicted TIM-barrel fold metal-dependent hydrolase
MHIFQSLGGPAGFESVERHMTYVKGYNSMPIRRKRDGTLVSAPMDWDRVDAFRCDRFGRYEWSLDGYEYYVQQFSPSLQTMESSPEFVLAQMEHVGIDVCVLQHDNTYGRYNELFSETMRTYPGRFLGLAKIEEAEATTSAQIGALHHCAEDLALPGLFFQQSGFPDGTSTIWSDAAFAPFWDHVRALGLVVYLHGVRDYPAATRLARRYPETWFMTGLPASRFAREGHHHIPEAIAEMLALPNVLAEICPIAYGFYCEYPYREMHPTIQPLYEAFGGTKFCWGSDMPNLERFCTYLQGLDFLRRHCPFIAREDMPLILGGNATRAFNLPKS